MTGYPEPPMPGPDPRTEGAVRIPDFYLREDTVIECRECRHQQTHLTAEWLDGHTRETVGCPNCGISSRIPVYEPEG